MSIENEVKLDVNLLFEGPKIRIGNGISRIEYLPEKQTETIYFDLPNHELSAANLALRFRYLFTGGFDEGLSSEGEVAGELPDGIWAVKSGGTVVHDDGVVAVARDELEAKGDYGTIPDQIIAQCPFLAGMRTNLKIIAALKARRRTIKIYGYNGCLVAIDDDIVEVTSGAKLGNRFREIEFELMSETGRSVRSKIVNDFLNAGAQYSRTGSKLERALGI